jgi:hypothetical protein
MIFDRKDRCPSCRAALPEDCRFCPNCGAPGPNVYRVCRKEGCDGIATPTDKICHRCGMELPPIERELTFDFLWDPPAGELARRYRVDTGEQAVSGRITVRFGHGAMLLGDGAFLKTLQPGSHAIESTFRDLQVGAEGARRKEVVYFDVSEFPLRYTFHAVRSNDGLPMDVETRTILEIASPERLLANLMKGAVSLPSKAIGIRLQSVVRNAVEDAARDWTASEAIGSEEFKGKLNGTIQAHMRTVLEGYGLEVTRVETLDVHVPDLDEIRELMKERGIVLSKEKEALALAKQDAEWHRRKAQAWADLRQSMQNARMDEIRDESAMKDFLRNNARSQLENEMISESELAALADQLSYEKADRHLAREFLVRKLEQEQRFELDRAEVLSSGENRLLKLEQVIHEERLKAEAAVGNETGLIDLEAYRKRVEQEAWLRERTDELGVQAKLQELEAANKRLRVDLYSAMKELKSRLAREEKLTGAGAKATVLQAGKGMAPELVIALGAEGDAGMQEVMKEYFSKTHAEETAAREKEFRERLDAVRQDTADKDDALLHKMVDRSFDAMAQAVETRATAGDREAAAIRDVIGAKKKEEDKPEVVKKCHSCGCDYTGKACPFCGPPPGNQGS